MSQSSSGLLILFIDSATKEDTTYTAYSSIQYDYLCVCEENTNRSTQYQTSIFYPSLSSSFCKQTVNQCTRLVHVFPFSPSTKKSICIVFPCFGVSVTQFSFLSFPAFQPIFLSRRVPVSVTWQKADIKVIQSNHTSGKSYSCRMLLSVFPLLTLIFFSS